MILTDQAIRQRVKAGQITIAPRFEEIRLGSNSYDLTLNRTLLVYTDAVLDCKRKNNYRLVDIPDDGYVLQPGELYLGCTNEYISSKGLCPQIEGKSSIARLGICIHLTAGFGDIGFSGSWTLEITCVKPVQIYSNMPIAQIYFLLPMGECEQPYNNKFGAKYADQPTTPIPSHMWKNFPDAEKLAERTESSYQH